MRIGELSRLTGVSLETLRYDEQAQLLSAAELHPLQHALQQLRGRCAAPASAGDCGTLRSLTAAAHVQR